MKPVLASSALVLWIDVILWRSGDDGPVGLILMGVVPQAYVLLPILAALWAWRQKARRFALLGFVVGLAQIFGPCGFCFGRPQAGPADLRVMTYNVANFGPSEEIARVIRAADPDVFFLQEAFRDDLVPYRPFMDGLPEYHFFAENGLMIGSKRPLIQPKTHLFASHGKRHHWNIQEALVEVAGRRVRLAGLHMVPDGYVPPDWPALSLPASVERKRRLRDEETDELLRIVAASPEPVVVGGDFNQHAFGPRYRRLASQLTDAYRSTSFGFGYTLTVSFPTKRVDYVWARGLNPLRSWVPSTSASDHLPVVCELRF